MEDGSMDLAVPDTVVSSLGVEREALIKSPAGIQAWMTRAAFEIKTEQPQTMNSDA